MIENCRLIAVQVDQRAAGPGDRSVIWTLRAAQASRLLLQNAPNWGMNVTSMDAFAAVSLTPAADGHAWPRACCTSSSRSSSAPPWTWCPCATTATPQPARLLAHSVRLDVARVRITDPARFAQLCAQIGQDDGA